MWELGLSVLLAISGLIYFMRRGRHIDRSEATIKDGEKHRSHEAQTGTHKETAIKPTRAQRGRSSQQLTARRAQSTGRVLHESEKVVFATNDLTITASTSLREVPFPDMDGPSYRIGYVDRDGVVTEREIIVQWVNESDTSIWMTAFCRLRGAVREFRADRIVSMVDANTGDNIANPAHHLRWLDKHVL